MTEVRATKEIKFAVIPDQQGRADGDRGYTLYYVAGDKAQYGECRWILEDNAGVTCTNYSIGDLKAEGEEIEAEMERLEAEINATIEADAGDISTYYAGYGTQGSAGSEAEGLMVQWGWLVPALMSTAQAADILGISEIRVRQLCQGGRMGRKVGRDWVISIEDIERNRERNPIGRPNRLATIDLGDIDHVRLTAGGVEILQDRIPWRDLADELQAGQVVSYHEFRHEGGQSGAILVVHNQGRAGITHGGNSLWGDWDDEAQTVRLDDADEDGLTVVYRTDGRRVVEE